MMTDSLCDNTLVHLKHEHKDVYKNTLTNSATIGLGNTDNNCTVNSEDKMLSTTVALATTNHKKKNLDNSDQRSNAHYALRPHSEGCIKISQHPNITIQGQGQHDRQDSQDSVFVPESELSDQFKLVMRDKSDTYPRRRRSSSIAEVKEHAFTRLQEELKKAELALQLKDEEVEKLSHVKDQMGEELEDLTASLFEEANNMVQDANIKRMHSEKLLNEANDKIEVLQAEVIALKALVLTSTPSTPNRHLHPQIDRSHSMKKTSGSESPKFFKGHKRSTSHHDITGESMKPKQSHIDAVSSASIPKQSEPHPVLFQEFRTWKQEPSWDKGSNSFLARAYHEDIVPCLNFSNIELSKQVLETVENNSLTVEPMPGNHGNGACPRKCALCDITRVCPYRIKIGEDHDWHFISQTCRDRIISVCDFYMYIRYIHQGLVKCEEKDMYWHIIDLKKKMALSRLGIS